MLAAIRSAAVLGIDAFDVTVEVDVQKGLPNWTMVGTQPLGYSASRAQTCSRRR